LLLDTRYVTYVGTYLLAVADVFAFGHRFFHVTMTATRGHDIIQALSYGYSRNTFDDETSDSMSLSYVLFDCFPALDAIDAMFL
jgi:hypothetical protein